MKRRFSILVCTLLMVFMYIYTGITVSADEGVSTITFTDESGNEVEALNGISILNAVYDVKNVSNGILYLAKYDVKDDLDDALFDVALTLNIEMPVGWENVYVVQNEQGIAASVNNGILSINVVPDSGIVTIIKAK